jgi:arginase family enzyme
MAPGAVHLNLDDAWEAHPLGLPCVDARQWGPRVRYFAPERLLRRFYEEVLAPLPPFVLYGSGDFHHLAGWLLRRVQEPVTVISFDNHPDWDIRPPRWACGAWINRALALPTVQKVTVWGCGNFELNWPSRLFANRRDVRSGRLEIHPWAERFKPSVARRFNAMTRENWRERFEQFATALEAANVYVTVDLDCLTATEATTNWENGLFTAADVAWALATLRRHARIVAGDLCGAYSPPRLERWTQRLASRWDHPPQPLLDAPAARASNANSLRTIWPALTGDA